MVRGLGGSRDSIKRVPKPERVRELIEKQGSTAPELQIQREERGVSVKLVSGHQFMLGQGVY
jgi:hypothetical protein